MQSRIISVIIGLVLVTVVGLTVYKTKKPPILPVDTTQNSLSSTPQSNPAVSQPSVRGGDDEGEDDDDDNTQTPPPAPAPTPGSQPSGITLSQVATHNSSSSCWSAINGNVYDLTSWIPNHPGGEQVILSLCGRDGTSDFKNQHGSQSRPNSILVGFKIGILVK